MALQFKLLLSPAKRLSTHQPFDIADIADIVPSEPIFKKQTQNWLKGLSQLDELDLIEWMGVSASIASLNVKRYQQALTNKAEVMPAIFMFQGDAYQKLDASSLSVEQLNQLNQRLFILSGLFGILKPFDRVFPYRLEMGLSFHKLKTPKSKILFNSLKVSGLKHPYQFWQNHFSPWVESELKGVKAIINLASKEYAQSWPKCVSANLKQSFITIDFRQMRKGEMKSFGILCKQARGLMARFVATEGLEKVEDLKAFHTEGYRFEPRLSQIEGLEQKWCFVQSRG